MTLVRDFADLSMKDLPQVGGKNASIGEMTQSLTRLGVRIPEGFATTAEAFREFLVVNNLTEKISTLLESVDVSDVVQLARVGAEIRQMVMAGQLQESLVREVREAFAALNQRFDAPDSVSWAIRSSATAEDLPGASFAGQQETFLNVQGIENVLNAIRGVYASLYKDRAIAYRVENGFKHSDVAISAGVQRMIRSDLASSGVIFTVDTETGFENVVFVTSSYGLGEAVVQGMVNPDEFYVFKPALRAGKRAVIRRSLGEKALKMIYTQSHEAGKSITSVSVNAADRARFSITDSEAEELARHALTIEEHYGRAMDIEWAKDGDDGLLYILQSRPETVNSNRNTTLIDRYVIKTRGEVLVRGKAIGQKIGTGLVRVLTSTAQMKEFKEGDVLVADITDPDWEPIMKRASAIVTNRGGRTCHAAIIARELGIPAVVGTGNATAVLRTGKNVSVSCAEGEAGVIYDGIMDFEIEHDESEPIGILPVQIMMNVATPDQAFALSRIPNQGVGLARVEFIISNEIGIHPLAVLNPAAQPTDVQEIIVQRSQNYLSPRDFYVQTLASGVAMIAAAFSPNPVIVRLSDFKTNEYEHLVGGPAFEPHEENPMIGFRGASRYVSTLFKPAFEMECEAMRIVRDEMGLTNVKIMIPFVRTIHEAHAVIGLLGANGLVRGENGLEVIMMCEIPSNVILATEFLEIFDGFSIGSNDLTQLTLGIDRDSELLASEFDERNEAVMRLMAMAISACKERGKYVGICGQAPSDYPELAQWLVGQGIDSLSLNPDSVMRVRKALLVPNR
ncbi:MAG: phosphoenolpyruvate synthase [Actinomycetales bacterium]|nr:phosphoenolpyruvate synthase [Actinomycetales bacterium]